MLTRENLRFEYNGEPGYLDRETPVNCGAAVASLGGKFEMALIGNLFF